MSTALTRAFADADRCYASAKASASQVSEALLAHGPSAGMHNLGQRSDLSRAQEQYQHNRDWVFAAIRLIASRIAGQQILAGRKRSPGRSKHLGNVQQLDNHPALDVLHHPNPIMTSWGLFFVTISSLELTGRCLWWTPTVQGAKEVWPLPTHWIQSFEGTRSFTSFKIRPPGHTESFKIPADDAVHLHYPDPSDPHKALSPLQALATSVTADEEISQSQIATFRQGVFPSVALIVGKNPHPDIAGGVRPKLSPAQQRQLIGAVRRRYSGTYNNGDPLVLDGMLEDVKQLSRSPKEMSWLDSGKITKEKILLGFGVNEIVLGSKESNRATAVAADKNFCSNTINPKIHLLSEILTEQFARQFDDSTVLWIPDCIPSDAEMSLKWAAELGKVGAITATELRNLSPFDLPHDSQFDGPVRGQGRDQQLDDSLRLLTDTLDEIKRIESGSSRLPVLPSRFNGNGRARSPLL